jgi:hypothetical protein
MVRCCRRVAGARAGGRFEEHIHSLCNGAVWVLRGSSRRSWQKTSSRSTLLALCLSLSLACLHACLLPPSLCCASRPLPLYHRRTGLLLRFAPVALSAAYLRHHLHPLAVASAHQPNNMRLHFPSMLRIKIFLRWNTLSGVPFGPHPPYATAAACCGSVMAAMGIAVMCAVSLDPLCVLLRRESALTLNSVGWISLLLGCCCCCRNSSA